MTGLAVIGAGAIGAGALAGTAVAAGAGPAATPPSAPQQQTVSGVAANGVQLSMSVPAQLPLDLPGQQLPEREVDVTVKDVGGQGYSGDVNVNLTSEGSGVSTVSLRLDHYNLASGAWETETIPAGQGSFGVTDSVTIPAGGSQVLKLRLSPGTTAVDDVKVTASADGASVVAAIPVTGPAFQASGMTASARVGTATVFTGKLTNPTDVGLQHVPVVLMLCPNGPTGCVAHASDVKVEVQASGGAWHGVSVVDAAGSVPMHATVLPDLAVAAGGTAQFSVRVTVGAGAFGAVGSGSGSTSGSAAGPGSGSTSGSGSGLASTPGLPSSPTPVQPLAVPVMLGPAGLTLVGQSSVAGTVTVQSPPQQPTPSAPSTPSVPSSSSATPGPTTSSTDGSGATPSASDTPTPTPAPASSNDAAGTPGAGSSSSSPTILVAAGLLAVCLALLLWWTLMKRRERMAREDVDQ
ncbi:hypothetical protein [Catenulispora pinisilvae]|uniref:hypothetical protein n=1 Tax=Catenulispora pinisilvae TaxID=2705253 RepID=UPI0018924467|nr:hypothetical protein [Catenulispora pinisilvae]